MARARLPSVFVISIRRNQSRLARALASCAVHGVVVHVIDGIDADHDFHKLKSYRDMLGPDFWGGPEIKPGAFACFLSHRVAWDAFLRSGEERAIFIEDDGLLTSGRFAAPNSDLVFLNARMAAWSRAVGSTAAEDIVAALAVGFDPGARGLALGPGGDGYFMTRHGAMIASEHSRVDRIRCGVDWYLLMLGGGVNDPSSSAPAEVKSLWDMYGSKKPVLSSRVAEPAIVRTGAGPSSIQHSWTVPISDFFET